MVSPVASSSGSSSIGRIRDLSDCPVCEQTIPSAADFCGACGYSTALALDALRALSEGDPTPFAAYTSSPATPPRRRAARPAAPSPEEQLVQRIAQEVDANLGILQELGGETLDVATDERQAAIAEADGRVIEALDIMRRALGRVQEQSESLFQRRIAEVEQRDAALRASGVGSSVAPQAAQMRALFRDGRRLDAIAVLRSADQYLGRIEGDWKGLQGQLKQIEGLRQSVSETGGPIPEVEADVQEVRALLAAPNVGIERLESASQTASRAITLLHEALPKALEEELGRHETTLSALPSDHDGVRRARSMHQEAVRHLRRGRLNEATASVRDLRATLLLLEKEPPVVAEDHDAPRAPAATPAPVNPNDSLQRLLAKARDLAARVRTLPSESEIAYEAAGEIRLATELLRGRKLEEADATLSRLMRTLDSELPREE
jgi:hypothetical protein